ncbi:MAG: hypothetical protein WD273_06090 [Trueperaceae bacterium]
MKRRFRRREQAFWAFGINGAARMRALARGPSLLLALALLLVLAACLSPPNLGGEGDPPPGDDMVCAETPAGSPEPTLECRSEEAGVALAIPWQGAPLEVEILRVNDQGDLSGDEEFQPLSSPPLIHFRVVDEASGTPVEQFEPQLELTVEYGNEEFDSADPRVNEGELGLGTWDGEPGEWLIAGHGVFESGFWVADPRLGQEALTLMANADERIPRFKMTGDETAGHASALISRAPSSLALAWGAMPFDEGHMLVAFDPCQTTEDPELAVMVVECISTDGAVTVRVPYQQNGAVAPRVIALPWNKDQTLETPTDAEAATTEHDRSLMNFLVVNAADRTTVLTSFDPPIEYEIVYSPSEIFVAGSEQEFRDLTVSYWDEETEELVVLGGGNTSECFDLATEQLKVGCPWGQPQAATPTNDPAYVRATETEPRFYRMEDAQGNGRAKFFFDRWGDRMVAFGR